MTLYIRTELIADRGIGHFARMVSLARWATLYNVPVCFIVEVIALDDPFQRGVIRRFSQVAKFDYQRVLPGTGDRDQKELWVEKLIQTDTVIVDSYLLNSDWLKHIKDATQNVILVDDLPHSKRCAPYIIDATFLSERKGELGEFIGAEYFFASPLLTQLHMQKTTTIERQSKDSEKAGGGLFIGFGGSDTLSLIPATIDHLQSVVERGTPLFIAVSPEVGHFQEIQDACEKWPGKVTFVSQQDDVILALSESSMAIGAAGGTIFERALLGLPSLVVQVADNQSQLFDYLIEQELAWPLMPSQVMQPGELEKIYCGFVENSEAIQTQRSRGLAICKGLGASWLAQWITKIAYQNLYLAPPGPGFKEQLFTWQSDPSVRRYARNSSSPSWEEHSTWYDRYAHKVDGLLMQIKVDEHAVGMMRLDHRRGGEYEISIIIAPDWQGKGIAKLALTRIKQLIPFITLLAYVDPRNIPSEKIFRASGFSPIGNNWYLYRGKDLGHWELLNENSLHSR